MKFNCATIVMYLSCFLILYGVKALWWMYIFYGILGFKILFIQNKCNKNIDNAKCEAKK